MLNIFHPRSFLLLLGLGLALLIFTTAGTAPAPVLTSTSAPAPNPRVLILDSYSPSYQWSTAERAGVYDTLFATFPRCQFISQFLDSKRDENLPQSPSFLALLREKMAVTPPDLIITLDDPALQFWLNRRGEFNAAHLPVVFCGINSPGDYLPPPPHNLTGVFEYADFPATLALAQKLFPQRRRIHVVSDFQFAGQTYRKELQAHTAAFADTLAFTYNQPGTFAAWNQELRNLGADTTILILPTNADNAGEVLGSPQSTALLLAGVSAPAFAITSPNLGAGILGGYLVDGYDHGRSAGTLAVKVLSGTRVDQIPILRTPASTLRLDARQLERFQIPTNQLPPGTELLFVPPSPWLVWKNVIVVGGSAGLIILVALVILTATLYSRLYTQRLLGSVMTNTPDAYIVLHPDGKISTCLSNVPGLGEATPHGAPMPLNIWIDPDSLTQMQTLWSTCLREQKPQTGEFFLPCHNGPHWFECVYTPLRTHRHSAPEILWIARDINPRKQIENMLISARQAADAANQAKSQFLANMSHEIRNPMASIIGFAELLSDAPLDTEQRENVAAIVRNGRHLVRLINDILDISRIEAGRLKIDYAWQSLPTLIAETLESFQPQASAKNLALTATFSPNAPEQIWTDPQRLRQILINLIGNALKFTAAGSVTVKVTLLPLPDTQRLAIDIIDTGPGIAPENLPRLFQHFSQADDTLTRKHGGTGLGLAISRRLAQALGGDITVSTELNIGSTFHLELPTQPPTPA
jgi:signal transduction histidine kinase